MSLSPSLLLAILVWLRAACDADWLWHVSALCVPTCRNSPSKEYRDMGTNAYRLCSVLLAQKKNTALTNTHILTHTHTHTHSPSHTHSHALTHPHSPSHTHALTYTHTHTHPNSHSRTCTHACTHAFALLPAAPNKPGPVDGQTCLVTATSSTRGAASLCSARRSG